MKKPKSARSLSGRDVKIKTEQGITFTGRILKMIQEESAGQQASSADSKGFHPFIIRKKDSFCVYLPEWRVSGVGGTLEEAYMKFERNMKDVESNAAAFGLSALTPEPYPLLKKRFVLQELALFFVKVASSAFIVILLVVLLLPNIAAALRHNLREMLPKEIISAELKDPRYWAIQFPAQMNARLDRLKPEEEEQMRSEWNRLLGRTVPIVSPLTCQPQAKAKPARP